VSRCIYVEPMTKSSVKVAIWQNLVQYKS